MERKSRALVWAHRGASGYAPENTMEAFRLAERQGADGIELDVQLSRDGEVVVIHDERVDRTSYAEGYVRDFTLAQLRKFNFNRTHPECPRAQIPLLSEVLALVKQNGMTLNIELKNGVFAYEGMEEKVIGLVHEAGVQEQVLYSSFNHHSIVRVGQLDPAARRAILLSDGWIGIPAYAAGLGVEAVHLALWHLAEEGFVRQCHARGLKVHVWTVNEKAQMRACLAQGVDAIITNYPDVCGRVLVEQDVASYTNICSLA